VLISIGSLNEKRVYVLISGLKWLGKMFVLTGLVSSSKKVFAIGDCHLPVLYYTSKYPVPGDYFERLRAHLKRHLPEVLLIAGDLSWGRSLEEVRGDILQIQNLPGKYKIFVEGNHDKWFDNLGTSHLESQKKAYNLFSTPDFYYVGGRAITVRLENGSTIGVCGSRGFAKDVAGPLTDEEASIRKRELDSLDRSLTQFRKNGDDDFNITNICLLHYPPSVAVFSDGRHGDGEFLNRIREAKNIQKVIFGHVHGDPHLRLNSITDGIELYCVVISLTRYRATQITCNIPFR
jgi:predicted phosphohydrolase